MTELMKSMARAEALSRRIDATERQIMRSAEARLSQVDKELNRIRAASVTTPGVDGQYQDLIEERGRLNQVIAASSRALSGR